MIYTKQSSMIVRLTTSKQPAQYTDTLSRRRVQRFGTEQREISRVLFLPLDLHHSILHRVPDHNPRDVDMLLLPDPMHAVHSLSLNRRIPPQINEDDVISRHQVQSQCTAFQRDQQHLLPVSPLELVQYLLPLAVFGASIIAQVANAVFLEHELDQSQHRGPLRIDQDLITRIVSVNVQDPLDQHVRFR